MTMIIPRGVCLLAAVLYGALGLWVLAQPDRIAGMIGLAFAGPAGRLEFLVAYGAFYLGIGAFLAVGAVRRSVTGPALALFALTSTAIAVARALGLIDLADPPAITVNLLWAELVMVAAGWIGLLLVRPPR